MNLPLFIAKRIYAKNEDSKRQVSKPAVKIATAGVAIGLAVMLVSVSVVFGFKHTIRDKVVGFGSHIVVADFLTLQTSEQHPIVIDGDMMKKLKGIEGIKHVQRYAMKQGILKTDSDFLGVVFKGIGPEYDTTFIHNNMKEGVVPKFDDQASHNKILISQVMANKLKVKAGQGSLPISSMIKACGHEGSRLLASTRRTCRITTISFAIPTCTLRSSSMGGIPTK